MSKPIFVDWCPKDVLDGVQMLEPMEELAYRRILDLIYVTGDNLPDDDKRMAWMTKAARKWPAIKKALIDMEKIQVVDGRITNHRCRETLQKTAQKIEQKRGAGKASAEARKSLENNKTASTGVGASVTTGVPTTQEPKNPKEEGGGGSAHATEQAQSIPGTDPEATRLQGATEPALIISRRFLELRAELWPNCPNFPAPTTTLEGQAAAYLGMGGTVPLILEVIERGMRTAARQGKTATVSLKAFNLSLTDAIASHRAGVNVQGGTHGPNTRSVPAQRGRLSDAEQVARIAEVFADRLGDERGSAAERQPAFADGDC